MIDTSREVRELGQALLARGVAAGRPFPSLERMLRVTIGTDAEMGKFREAFAAAMGAG
jgi:histidinol-phosphate/aromatic aminotransferase/cobyric acid decarboxylase-like protein